MLTAMIKYSSRFIAAILFLTFTIHAAGQTFQRTYGSVEDDLGTQVLLTQDSAYAVVGTYGATGGMYLMKADSKGNSVWQKTYNPPNMLYYYSDCHFRQTPDKGFIITGSVHYTTKSQRDICLIKTNSSGDTIWTKFYSGPSPGPNFASAYEIILTSDGGYAIVGSQLAPHDANVFLLKTDDYGNLQWSKYYGGTSDDEGYSLKQTGDGGYIITGYTNSFGQGKDVYLLKVNSTGNLLWTKTYGGDYPSSAKHIEITKDGGFILTGTYGYLSGGKYVTDLFLMKLDLLGHTSWSYAYGGNLNEAGISVKQTDDGGFIATGYTASSGAGQEDVYLLRTNSLGADVWSKNYGGSSTERGNDVIQHGSNYIIVGETRNFSKGLKDIYLIKTDSLRKDSCWQDVTITNKTALTWLTGSGGTENNGGVIRSHVVGVANPNTTSYNPCICVPPVSKFYMSMLDVTGRATNLSTWATTWHWDFGNGDTSAAENPTYMWKTAGTFKVCLTVKNACGSDTYCEMVDVSTEIGELKNNQLKLFIAPNPFDTFTSITFDNVKKEKLNLQLLNVLGQMVLQINNITDSNVQINKNGLPNGLYFIRLLKDSQVVGTDKLMIE